MVGTDDQFARSRKIVNLACACRLHTVRLNCSMSGAHMTLLVADLSFKHLTGHCVLLLLACACYLACIVHVSDAVAVAAIHDLFQDCWHLVASCACCDFV